jgi:hypothetical protein
MALGLGKLPDARHEIRQAVPLVQNALPADRTRGTDKKHQKNNRCFTHVGPSELRLT